MKIEIQLEQPQDYRTVEELTREAFWNIYVPGCSEHFIVHQLRKSSDFIPKLDFIAIKDHQIVGNIIYSHSKIIDELGDEHKVITFGPVSVLPSFQRQGIGSHLIEHSKKAATAMGFSAIVIYGYPEYYNKRGFKSAYSYGISRSDGEYAKALMVCELFQGALNNVKGRFFESAIFEAKQDELEHFEASFPLKEKKIMQSQKDFEIMSHSLE